MAVTKTYGLTNGHVKVQIEDLLGKTPGGGWGYQGPGVGNKNAEGAHYYYKSQMGQGSLKQAPDFGRFKFNLNITDPGKYSILLRATRDSNSPGDSRNDIWIKVDGGTQSVMPKGTPKLTSGGDGFVKFKGATTSWIDAKQFSTPTHGDKNAPSTVIFDKGMHSITFAPRSTGYHIDSVKVIKVGGTKATDTSATAVAAATELESSKTTAVDKLSQTVTRADDKDTIAVDKAGVVKGVGEAGVGEAGVVSAKIAAASDDFESNKAAASKDLEFGHDGAGEQSVGLRFKGIELDKDAEIKSAYFVFTAAETSKGAAHFEIEVEDTTHAATYTRANGPDARAYLAEDVDWDVQAWKKGETYKSADIAELIKEAIEDGGMDALDALAFRVSGSGERVAEAFESTGAAPELVIEYA